MKQMQAAERSVSTAPTSSADLRCWSPLLRTLGVALLVAASALLGTIQASAQEAVYTLGSGDRIKVTVFGHPDLSGEFVVGGEGVISLPLAGEVRAAGRSVREFEAAIVDALAPDYLKHPRVSAEVLNYRPFYILGEVRNPGSYPYVAGMRILNAVALAGGFSYRADEDEVTIERSSKGEFEGGPDTIVLPGDIIHVPQRFF